MTKAKENGTRVVEEKVKECKTRLSQLNSEFESLEIDDKKLEEIMDQKASTELAEPYITDSPRVVRIVERLAAIIGNVRTFTGAKV